jgi:starch phosphorylase
VAAASFLERDAELRRAVDFIAAEALVPGQPGLFAPIVDELRGRDRYFLCADYRDYVDGQARAAATYARPDQWWRMSILNTAGMGYFSSDRTTAQYAAEIWQAPAVPVPPAP